MGDSYQTGYPQTPELQSSLRKKLFLRRDKIQDVPELTKDSQADICFKGEGLCVIYLADGVAPAADVDMLAGMKSKFTSQLDGRGTTFKWMWMDMAVETEFKTLFSPDVLSASQGIQKL